MDSQLQSPGKKRKNGRGFVPPRVVSKRAPTRGTVRRTTRKKEAQRQKEVINSQNYQGLQAMLNDMGEKKMSVMEYIRQTLHVPKSGPPGMEDYEDGFGDPDVLGDLETYNPEKDLQSLAIDCSDSEEGDESEDDCYDGEDEEDGYVGTSIETTRPKRPQEKGKSIKHVESSRGCNSVGTKLGYVHRGECREKSSEKPLHLPKRV